MSDPKEVFQQHIEMYERQIKEDEEAIEALGDRRTGAQKKELRRLRERQQTATYKLDALRSFGRGADLIERHYEMKGAKTVKVKGKK